MNSKQVNIRLHALQICAVELQWKYNKKTAILKNYSFLLLTIFTVFFASKKL